MTISRQVTQDLQVPIQQELRLTDIELGLLPGFAYAIFYALMALPLARITLLTTSLMGSFGPLVVSYASDRLKQKGFNEMLSPRYGAIALVFLEVLAFYAFIRCGMYLP